MAVDLAKLSLWLATLAKDHPFTFLDHALRSGDSLVGLTRRQIAAFHWAPEAQQTFIQRMLDERMASTLRVRRQILMAGDDMPPSAKRQQLDAVDEGLDLIRLAGDAAVAAFFAAEKPRDREERRKELLDALAAWMEHADAEARQALGEALADLRGGERPVRPFHWEIEFPEVFSGEAPGFDAIVGNPPFAGVTTLARSSNPFYTDWLRTCWHEAGGKCDLVAFFFRRAFGLLRARGAFGLLATNTIAQGDTRQSGLAPIRKDGGAIYSVTKRLRWPGQAAVVVSVVHVFKGLYTGVVTRNGQRVETITSFLFATGGDDMPARLTSPFPGVTKGVVPYGVGFVIDDSTEGCIRTEQIEKVLAKEPASRRLVFDYIGGEDFNSTPDLRPSKRIVNFGEMEYDEAVGYPALLALIERTVKPGRDALTNQSGAANLKKFWWRYQYSAKELFAAARSLRRVVAIARVTRHVVFGFLPTGIVYNEKLVVFPTESPGSLALLQSRLHDSWAWFFSSTMKDDLNYSPTDCFETFPFPEDFETSPALEGAGKAYYEFRADLMVCNNDGLTKTYNRFHDPNETSADIQRLRELHDAMDRAVLDAYGWTDIRPTCEFILDYEEEDDEEESSGRSRKKPWRYRWPDDIRDEVLARLLALNTERAAEERLSGLAAAAAEKKKAKKTKRGRKRKAAKSAGPSLLDTKE